MSNKEEQELKENQWATFYLENELYGVDVLKTKEVLQYQEPTPIPGSAFYNEGVINLRGNVITIISLRKLMGIDNKNNTKESRIIVVNSDNKNLFGFLVDQVEDVKTIQDNKIDPNPSLKSKTIEKQFFYGITMEKERLILLLDLNKVFEQIIS